MKKQAHSGITRFSAFHSRISVQSTPQTHPSAQKIWRPGSGGELRKAFGKHDLHVCPDRDYPVYVQTGPWAANEPVGSRPSPGKKENT